LVLPAPLAATGVATYFCLVLNYEWIHYLIHTSYAPRTWFYRRLWLNHRLHHFKNEQFWYGVTMLTGDRLLGTQPIAGQTLRSETCRTLGVVDDDGTAARVLTATVPAVPVPDGSLPAATANSR
jgi:sterol desaturase/sphingolipid hydroxylase (fatty acid hydroxylase superfamily)